LVAFSCPFDCVIRAFHELDSVAPLSAIERPQDVLGLELMFFTVTFAQYPVDHCDWYDSSADIVPSELSSSPSSDWISSSSGDAAMQAARQQAIETEPKLSRLAKRMNFLLGAAERPQASSVRCHADAPRAKHMTRRAQPIFVSWSPDFGFPILDADQRPFDHTTYRVKNNCSLKPATNQTPCCSSM
jgi:hypothetical protein